MPWDVRNVEAMRTALNGLPGCKLTVIDPVGSHLGAGVDSDKDNEVRGVLAPLLLLAAEAGVAVLLVCHTRKAAAFADDTALGSRAFVGLARSVLHLSADDADRGRKLLLPGKRDLATAAPGLAFRITGDPPRPEWEPDPIDGLHADDVRPGAGGGPPRRGPAPKARNAATAWLTELLHGGPVPSANVQRDAKAAERDTAIRPETTGRSPKALKRRTTWTPSQRTWTTWAPRPHPHHTCSPRPAASRTDPRKEPLTASIADDPNGRRRILFVAPDGSRKTVRLGKTDRRSAEAVARHVEALLAAKIGGQPVPRDTAAWVGGVGATLKDKLAAVGLIDAPKRTQLGEFLAAYVLNRPDVKSSTLEIWQQPCRNLTAFFGAGKPLRAITAGDGDRAGLDPRPRLFHNLRSSRETELLEVFPVPVVAQWMGHDPKVCFKHYAQATDDHFARGAGGAKSGTAGGRRESHGAEGAS